MVIEIIRTPRAAAVSTAECPYIIYHYLDVARCGANVNRKNDKGETPYDLAVKDGHEVVMKRFASAMGQSSLDKLTRPRGISQDL